MWSPFEPWRADVMMDIYDLLMYVHLVITPYVCSFSKLLLKQPNLFTKLLRCLL